MKTICTKCNILLIAISISTISYSQKIPTFKIVVTEFFKKYTFESEERYLRFEKKKDGWYVAQESYTTIGHHNSILFWSLNKDIFLKIDYPLANTDTAVVTKRVNDYLQQIGGSYEEYQFQRHKYYGYTGWEWDIINEPVDRNKMTDSAWESLAKAYSNYASGFIAEQYGDLFENNDKDRRPLIPNDLISKARIDKFIFFENQAIDAYKKVISINPNYQTIIGDIKIKYANEYLYAYSELMLANDTIAAKKFALKANYSDSIIEIYKPCLTSLPANSILITGGDNDTYVLWYLQEVMNYRKDIIILNVNYLGLRRYLFINNKRYKEKLFNTPDSIYFKNNFDYFIYSSSNTHVGKMEIASFISNLNIANNPYDNNRVLYKNEPIKTYFTKELFFTPRKSGLDLDNQKMTSKTISLKNCLYMNEFIQLDIISANIGKKKIFFTFQNDFLSNILVANEIVYEVKIWADDDDEF